jgi:hypothetical protein
MKPLASALISNRSGPRREQTYSFQANETPACFLAQVEITFYVPIDYHRSWLVLKAKVMFEEYPWTLNFLSSYLVPAIKHTKLNCAFAARTWGVIIWSCPREIVFCIADPCLVPVRHTLRPCSHKVSFVCDEKCNLE